jgi:hypothetical protein
LKDKDKLASFRKLHVYPEAAAKGRENHHKILIQLDKIEVPVDKFSIFYP